MSSKTENSTAGLMTKDRVVTFYGTKSEQERLHAQHTIGITAFSNQLLVFPGAQDVLDRPNLRILDNAGADGFWLAELRKQIKHPESAELVAADVAPYPGETGEIGVGQGIRLVKQDMTEEWPAEWDGRFDLVHQRACVLFHPTWSSAVAATGRLLRLLQPGGYIQLIDGVPAHGPIQDSDSPNVKSFKSIIRASSSSDAANGIDPPIAHRLPELIAEAAAAEGIELEDVGHKKGVMKWGKGAGSPELELLGVKAVEDMVKNMEALWERRPEARRMGTEEWEKLRGEVLRQVRENGFEIVLNAVWGRRKA